MAKENEELRKELSFNAPASSTLNPTPNDQFMRILSETLSSHQNPITASALTPCLAQDGGDIQITDYECWKRRFEAWLKASNITDPESQQMYFEVYAGDKLTVALITAPDVPSTGRTGYNLTVQKLDAVFKSRSSSFALKKDFRSITQKEGETNVAYLTRLMKAALRIWDRTDPKIDDEIMLTMTVNSNNSKMQEFALRVSADSSDKNKYEDLVNQARLVDSLVDFRSNLSESRVLAVSDRPYVPKPTYAGNSQHSENDQRFKNVGREQAYRNRGNEHLARNSFKRRTTDTNEMNSSHRTSHDTCFRCGEKGHTPYECRHRNESCSYCRYRGHSVMVCRSRIRKAEQENPPKKARVDMLETEPAKEKNDPYKVTEKD